MRHNPTFEMTDLDEIRRVIETNPWATIVSDGPNGLVASHCVLLLDDDRGELTLVGHVGRPDDEAHGLGQRELLACFQGPHGYISPGWYGDIPGTPTWDFIAVHVAGVPELLDDEENLVELRRLVHHFEQRMPKPRLLDELPNDPARIRGMSAGTVGFRLTPTRVVAKSKLSQNKPAETVATIVRELEGNGPYSHPALAAEVRRAHKNLGVPGRY